VGLGRDEFGGDPRSGGHRFPACLQMYGVWWAGAEPDVVPTGNGGQGLQRHRARALRRGRHANVHKDILKHVYDKGQGTAKSKDDVGSVLYNRGMISAMLTVESIKQAQSKFGKRVVTGEEVRWGAENLSSTSRQDQALGFGDIVQPVKTSCKDHAGVAPRPRPHLGRQGLELHVRLVPGGLQGDPAPGRLARPRRTRRREEDPGQVHVRTR
jgi:hypothetical protein